MGKSQSGFQLALHLNASARHADSFFGMKKAKPQRRELSTGTRWQIVGMHKLGKKFVVIGRILNVPADTVRKVWNRYQQTGTCESASRSGRPTKLTDRDRRQLKRYIPSGRPERRKALQDISAILNLPIKPDTLKAEIRKFGLHLRIERKTPYLSHHQKAARLKFAWEYIH